MQQHVHGIVLPDLLDQLQARVCFHSFLKFLSHQWSSYSESASPFSEHLFVRRCFVLELICLSRTLIPYWGESVLMQTDSYRESRADPSLSPSSLMSLTPRLYQTLFHRFFYMGSIQLDSFQYIPLFHCPIDMTPCISGSLHWLRDF